MHYASEAKAVHHVTLYKNKPQNTRIILHAMLVSASSLIYSVKLYTDPDYLFGTILCGNLFIPIFM